MSKNSILVNQKGPLTDFLLSPEKYGAVFTGSRAFGVGEVYSDWDYFMLGDNWEALAIPRYQIDQRYDDSEFQSMRFHFQYEDINKDMNVLLMEEDEFKCWNWANTCFLELCKFSHFRRRIKFKLNRVRLFEEFKTAWRETRFKEKED